MNANSALFLCSIELLQYSAPMFSDAGEHSYATPLRLLTKFASTLSPYKERLPLQLNFRLSF